MAMMETMYWMLFDEVRHALKELKEGRHHEAEHALEATVKIEGLLEKYSQREEWQHWSEWRRSPEWLRHQWRLQRAARWNDWRMSPDWARHQWTLRRAVAAVPWVDPMPWEPWEPGPWEVLSR